jgi:hypothetical protein
VTSRKTLHGLHCSLTLFRSHFLRSYPNTFLGCDFCTWLVCDDAARSFNVASRQAAVACGAAMLQNKVQAARGRRR